MQKYIFAKHFVMQKYIFASHFVTQNVTNAFWRTFSKGKCSATRTFSKGKCSASHFTKENVQHHIFLCKMFSITFSKGKCSASHFTGAKIYFCKVKCYKSIWCKNVFDAEHFPKSNVQRAFFWVYYIYIK